MNTAASTEDLAQMTENKDAITKLEDAITIVKIENKDEITKLMTANKDEITKLKTENKDEITILKDANEKLQNTVSEYIQKAETVQISNLKIDMLEADGYICLSKAVHTVHETEFEIPEKFIWPVQDKEHDKINTEKYLEFLNSIAKEFKNLRAEKSIESPYLNTTVGVNPHRLRSEERRVGKECIPPC